jgi:hypothetical protein
LKASVVRPLAAAVKHVPHTPQQAAGVASIQRFKNGATCRSHSLHMA